MTLLGFGSLIGTLAIGYNYDKNGHKSASLQNIFLLVLVSIFLYGFIRNKTYGLVVFLMVFTWGSLDASIATHSYSSIGIEFNDSAIGYAIYNIF